MSQTTENAFTNVAVYSGMELAATGKQVEAGNALAATDQQRAIAEVQVALVIAQSRPRNEVVSRDRLLRACQRSGLAVVAVYQYPRGGTSVSGPSIRLAEAAARAWGNMTYGFRELSRRPGESECEAYAWDLETNTKAVRQFAVKHRRDTKQGGYDLKDERDIYELMANQAQRRVRAAILEIIPGDIIEDAMTQCDATLKTSVGGDIAKAITGMKDAFGAIGISVSAIEKRIGCRLEAIQPAQIMSMRKIYASIKDGFSEPSDWFEMEAPKPPANGEADKSPAAPAAAPAEPAGKKPPAGTGKKNPPAASAGTAPASKAPPANNPAQPAGPAPKGQGDLTHDPNTGEVFGAGQPQDAYLITCPKNDKQVDERDCGGKQCRNGCPQFM